MDSSCFNKVFPITDFSGIAELRFVKYELEDPRYDVDECIQSGGTYGSPTESYIKFNC